MKEQNLAIDTFVPALRTLAGVLDKGAAHAREKGADPEALLKERLADALEVQVGGVRLEGLRDCTKVLDAAGRWRSTCTRISDDISATMV